MSIKALEEHENSLESWRIKLADHFCEDPNTFKLEECFNVLDQFLEKMRAILNVCISIRIISKSKLNRTNHF